MTPTEARALCNFDDVDSDLAYNLREAVWSLADQVEALQKDAERYRWLSSNVDGVSWWITHDGNTGTTNWLVGAELDEAIDRAREAT